ncbi:MAG TPA: ribbon-helix-helix domain-containing protein [Xanthobacteraceae bacterium]|jgi:predicted DNA-binding ribbon-helix-helix protein
MPKHSIVYRGRKTSISLEAPFWAALQKIASERGQPISKTVAFIREQQDSGNLSSAIRVFVFDYFLNGMNLSLPSAEAQSTEPKKTTDINRNETAATNAPRIDKQTA